MKPGSDMADPTRLQAQIAEFFEKAMHTEAPAPGTDLFETGVLDSMAFASLVVHLEQEFGLSISVDDLELDNFRSLEKIAEFVAKRNGSRQAA